MLRTIYRLTLPILFSITTPVMAASQGINPVDANGQYTVSHQGIHSFDRKTLKRLWSVLEGEQTFEPVVTGDTLLVTTPDALHAYNQIRGTLLWKQLNSSTAFSPTVSRGVAYVAATDGTLKAIDIASGTKLWQKTFPGWIYPPAIVGQRLFTGGSHGSLWAVDSHNGKTLWQQPLGQELVYRPVVTPDGSIITTTFNRDVTAHGQNGERLWQVQLPAITTDPVSSEHGLIYLNGLDRQLYALESITGKEVWRHPLPSRLKAPITLNQERITAVTESGALHEIDPRTGLTLSNMKLIEGTPVGSPIVTDDNTIQFSQIRDLPRPVIVKQQARIVINRRY